MNKIVDFDGIPYELARLDRAAMESLSASGVLDELGPVELIDGVLVRMSPSQSQHGYAIAHLNAVFVPALRGRYQVGADIGVFLGNTTMHAPDISVVRKTAKPGFLDVSDVVMAIEISASSLSEDLASKAVLYASHGIPEYWVVDLDGRRLNLHRQPTARGYADVTAHAWTDTVQPSCAPDLDITLATILDGVV